jgi:predicted ATP-grasp superfamily ATP-dependent carboligase
MIFSEIIEQLSSVGAWGLDFIIAGRFSATTDE